MQSKPHSENKSRKGLAAADEEKQNEIAKKDSRVTHEQGTSIERNSKVKETGKKGGQSRRKFNKDDMPLL